MSLPTPPQRFPPEVALQFFRRGIVVPGFTREQLIALHRREVPAEVVVARPRRAVAPPKPHVTPKPLPVGRFFSEKLGKFIVIGGLKPPAPFPKKRVVRGKRPLVVTPKPPPPKERRVTPPSIVPDLTRAGIEQRQVEQARKVAEETVQKAMAAPPISEQILQFGKKTQEQIFGRPTVRIARVTRGLTEPFAPTKAAFPIFTAAGVVASVEGFVRPDVPRVLSGLTPEGRRQAVLREREFPGFGGGLILGELLQTVAFSEAVGRGVELVVPRRVLTTAAGRVAVQAGIGAGTGFVVSGGEPEAAVTGALIGAGFGLGLEAAERIGGRVRGEVLRRLPERFQPKGFKAEQFAKVAQPISRGIPTKPSFITTKAPIVKTPFRTTLQRAITAKKGQVLLPQILEPLITPSLEPISKSLFPIISGFTVSTVKEVTRPKEFTVEEVSKTAVTPSLVKFKQPKVVKQRERAFEVALPIMGLVPTIKAGQKLRGMQVVAPIQVQELAPQVALVQQQRLAVKQALARPQLLRHKFLREVRPKKRKKKRKISERERLLGRIRRLYPIALPSELLEEFL